MELVCQDIFSGSKYRYTTITPKPQSFPNHRLMINRLQAETRSIATASSNYWNQSRRPLASLFFVLPLLLCYEAGTLWLGSAAVRNGADIWLKNFLAAAGISSILLLPLLTVAILLAWHHTTGQPWRVSSNVIYTMAAESALLAVVLLAIAHVQANALSITGVMPACELNVGQMDRDVFGQMVRYFGAGVYEELLFRLILVPLAIILVGLAFASRKIKLAGALLLTSLIFAAAHYIGPQGDTFEVASFSFRFLAGGFFAILFICRGFGIAAGTHALYDLMVGFPAS